MDPLTMGIIGGGLSALMGYSGTQQSNNMSADQAKDMMYFQRDMSSSAHQREVTDLRLAGLNPILSAGGNGAPMASGAQGTVADLGKGLQGGMSYGADTAIALRGQNKQLEAQDTGIQNTKADTDNKRQTAELIANQTATTAQDLRQKAMSNQILQKTLNAQIKKANAEGNYAEINQLMGVINSGASTATQLINPLSKLKLPMGKK